MVAPATSGGAAPAPMPMSNGEKKQS
jgi:hypothetical protein